MLYFLTSQALQKNQGC